MSSVHGFLKVGLKLKQGKRREREEASSMNSEKRVCKREERVATKDCRSGEHWHTFARQFVIDRGPGGRGLFRYVTVADGKLFLLAEVCSFYKI